MVHRRRYLGLARLKATNIKKRGIRLWRNHRCGCGDLVAPTVRYKLKTFLRAIMIEEDEQEDRWDRERKRLQWLYELKREGKLPIELEIEYETLIRRSPLYLGPPGGELPRRTKPWLR